MKKIIVIAFMFLSFPLVYSQDTTETIFVSEANTTYLVFPKTIDLIDLGNPNDYYGKIEDKALLLKAKRERTSMSTLLVRSGESFYHYKIIYEKNPKVFFYNYSKREEGVDPVASKENSDGSSMAPTAKDLKLMQNKVDSIVNIKGEYNTLGVMSDFLQAAVTVIRNDKENTYLKIVIKNVSSIPYKFDFISFQYFQVMKKGSLKKTKNAPLDVFPIIYPKASEISASSTTVVGYAIPQFGLANNGYLVISFREKTGDRVLKIRIDSSVIQGAKYFNY